MDELHTRQKNPLSGTDPESYFNLHVLPPLDNNQKERMTAGTWHNITRLILGGWVSLALVGGPTRRGEL